MIDTHYRLLSLHTGDMSSHLKRIPRQTNLSHETSPEYSTAICEAGQQRYIRMVFSERLRLDGKFQNSQRNSNEDLIFTEKETIVGF